MVEASKEWRGWLPCPRWLKCQTVGAACACCRRPRNFEAQLEAARRSGDWEAHARIWEERRIASVDADERAIDDAA